MGPCHDGGCFAWLVGLLRDVMLSKRDVMYLPMFFVVELFVLPGQTPCECGPSGGTTRISKHFHHVGEVPMVELLLVDMLLLERN